MTASGRVAQVSGGVSQSAFDGSRLRVVLLLEVEDGAQQEFLTAYERMCRRVASTPGHVQDQVCQSVEDPAQWLITSEWESAPSFLAWVNSEEHLEMVRPLRACVRSMRSLRYGIVRETGSGRSEAEERPAVPVRVGDGVVRHALTYTVVPGSEDKVAEILAGHPLPTTGEGDPVRLGRTGLFLHGRRVVQTFELRHLQDDLLTGLLHLASLPETRALEEDLAPHLERERNLDEVSAAREFFTRAALSAVHHVASPRPASPRTRRCALAYPARTGSGEALARLLAGQDDAATADPHGPLRAATVFHRDDLVVRLVDLDDDPASCPATAVGLADSEAVTAAASLLDTAALGLDRPLTDDRALPRLLALAGMRTLADRTAADL